MEMGLNVGIQVIIMIILMGVGFVLGKMKKVNESGIKQMTDILLEVVTPCVIISSYQMDFDFNLAKGLGVTAIFTLVYHLVGLVLVLKVFPKESTLKYRINRFSALYSNCGFMAIPLIDAVLGREGVFYASGYLAVFNIICWTLGVHCYTEDKKSLSFKNAILNPGVIGVAIGLILFLCQIKLPYVLSRSVNYVAALNTPLAMIILGTFLVNIDVMKSIKNKSMYSVHAMRLIALPVMSILAAKMLGLDNTVARSLMISIACPTATTTTLFAAKYGLDAEYSSEVVVVSTLLSVITIPLLMIFASSML